MILHNPIHEAFEQIHATETMKQHTTALLLKEMQKHPHKQRFPMRYAVMACIMILTLLGGIGGYRLYAIPVSFISVDVNPSVELGLNQFDNVVEVKAYNDDGKRIIKNLNLKNKTYTEAIEMLLADKTFKSYLNKDALLSFTVVSDKEAEILTGIKQCHGYTQTKAECHSANENDVEEARRSGLSFGKYQAYLELFKYDKSITVEDCKELSMHQIRDLLSQYLNGVENPTLNDQENGQGHGRHRNGNQHGNGNHQ